MGGWISFKTCLGIPEKETYFHLKGIEFPSSAFSLCLLTELSRISLRKVIVIKTDDKSNKSYFQQNFISSTLYIGKDSALLKPTKCRLTNRLARHSHNATASNEVTELDNCSQVPGYPRAVGKVTSAAVPRDCITDILM